MSGTPELLEWDTRFFGVRIARIVGHTLDDATARHALDWCERERIDCLYLLSAADSVETVALAEKHGFGLKDVRVTYQRRLERALADTLPAPLPGVQIRPARPDDTPALEAIAEGGYTDSRFYFDRRFSRSAVDEM